MAASAVAKKEATSGCEELKAEEPAEEKQKICDCQELKLPQDISHAANDQGVPDAPDYSSDCYSGDEYDAYYKSVSDSRVRFSIASAILSLFCFIIFIIFPEISSGCFKFNLDLQIMYQSSKFLYKLCKLMCIAFETNISNCKLWILNLVDFVLDHVSVVQGYDLALLVFHDC